MTRTLIRVALRNALLPVVTVLGLQFGPDVGGAHGPRWTHTRRSPDQAERRSADPDFPVRLVPAYIGLDGSMSREAGAARVASRVAGTTDKLHFGLVKIVTDGSIQGFTARVGIAGERCRGRRDRPATPLAYRAAARRARQGTGAPPRSQRRRLTFATVPAAKRTALRRRPGSTGSAGASPGRRRASGRRPGPAPEAAPRSTMATRPGSRAPRRRAAPEPHSRRPRVPA